MFLEVNLDGGRHETNAAIARTDRHKHFYSTLMHQPILLPVTFPVRLHCTDFLFRAEEFMTTSSVHVSVKTEAAHMELTLITSFWHQSRCQIKRCSFTNTSQSQSDTNLIRDTLDEVQDCYQPYNKVKTDAHKCSSRNKTNIQ
jgi:hypothetical protein